MIRVLLVEDDRGISEPLARALRREGYTVDVHGTGAGALEAAKARPDLVVLDLGLPDMDGLEVCRRLRADGRTIPVLILTARADELDAVVGLDAGGDDYVTKPFRLAELLARVRALLRRHAGDGLDASTGALRIDTDARRAYFEGEEMPLTAKEFDLLRVLVREQGRVVTREQLMREVWDTEWFGSTKTLDMHISVLRRKLGDDVAHPRFISTVRGLGFRFDHPPT
ncbi:MAG: response regulator transcription factor [Dermatophilaceae bacterium]